MTVSIPVAGPPPSAPVPVVPLRVAVVRAPSSSDAEILPFPRRVQADENAAPAATLDALVRVHLPGLLRYASILTGDEHTAADLVQEVLLRAHVRWHRIALTERPDLYLRRMVTNEHLSWRRRWHVRTIRSASDDELAAHAPAAGDRAHAHAEHDAMWRRLAELPPRQRTVLVLRYYEDLSDPEIATVLDTTAATVRSHAARALATLRRSEHPQQPEKPTKPTLESR